MAQVIFTLETVTPLFLGGAEARGEPELRPASFRGALRYWLRAALGGAIGDRDFLPRLHKLESQVFGNAADDKGGQASAITVRFRSAEPGSSDWKRKHQPGHDYLYWALTAQGNYAAKGYYPADISLGELILSVRPGTENEMESLQSAVAALWLMTHLGGLGARSRRLAGNLYVDRKEAFPLAKGALSFDWKAGSLDQAADFLQRGLNCVRTHFNLPDPPRIQLLTPFDILHPLACKVWVLEKYSSSEQAVETIGLALKDFRSDRPDSDSKPHWRMKRAAFGLPIQDVEVSVRRNEVPINRRASPLWLTLHRSENHYFCVATVFYSRFLEAGVSLKTQGQTGKVENYQLIEDWLAEKFPGRTAVDYA